VAFSKDYRTARDLIAVCGVIATETAIKAITLKRESNIPDTLRPVREPMNTLARKGRLGAASPPRNPAQYGWNVPLCRLTAIHYEPIPAF
jgi:hypothetical protein